MAENPRIEELRRRVHADPASIAFAALAEEFRRVGRYEEAVEACRTGLHRHPAYLSARVTLGRALIETGDYEGAREELETVLRSAPENLAALRGLEQIRERKGHSSVMDPHLAEMMETMHAESLRPAAPPEPGLASPSPAPESDALADAPFMAAADSDSSSGAHPPEPVIDLSFMPAAHAAAAPDATLFPNSSVEGTASSREGTFDAGAGWVAPDAHSSHTAAADAPVDVFASFARPGAARPANEVSFDLSMPVAADRAEPPSTIGSEFSFGAPAPDPPDPAMIASLARLERFLDVIQSLRS